MSSKYRNERVASLKKMRSAAGSQWSFFRRGVTWSLRCLRKTGRAACFCIFCSRATCSEFMPARSELQWSVVENSNSNLKTLILKDSSVRFIWTYLTASPCYTTNTNKTTIPQTNNISARARARERERERERGLSERSMNECAKELL